MLIIAYLSWSFPITLIKLKTCRYNLRLIIFKFIKLTDKYA